MATNERNGDTTLARDRVAKLCGADVELGNFVLGRHRQDGTGLDASRALLREIDGVPTLRRASYPTMSYSTTSGCGGGYAQTCDPQDWGSRASSTRGPAGSTAASGRDFSSHSPRASGTWSEAFPKARPRRVGSFTPRMSPSLPRATIGSTSFVARASARKRQRGSKSARRRW